MIALCIRYKLHVQVKDDLASTTFVVFDREAEKILKVPVTQLYKGKNILEVSNIFKLLNMLI